MRRQRAALPFIALATAFVTLGVTTNRTFLFVGVVFLVIGIGAAARGRAR